MNLVSDQPTYTSSNPESMVPMDPTENLTSQDYVSSQHNPSLRSRRMLDEFVKIRNFMEKFPLPGNDVELGFPLIQTPEGTVTDNGGYVGPMTDLLISLSLKCDTNIQKLNGVIDKAVEELRNMVLENEPLWVYDEQKRTQVLNNAEYNKRFKELEMTLDSVIKVVSATEMPSQLPEPDLNGSVELSHIVGTREIVFVSMPPLCIIEIMIDVRLWSFVFGDLLSRAVVLETLASGHPSTHNGVVQVMSVEYHGPSPLLPTRQCYFVRHCKQLASNAWMIFDIPIEEIVPNPCTSFKRRPSGCLIEGLDPDGYSKVTWIEHFECENQDVHPLFKPLLDSGFMFGAKRWANLFRRQCQHLKAIAQRSLSTLPTKGLDGLLRLRDRMRRSFYGNLSGSSLHLWKALLPRPEAQDILIRTNKFEHQDVVTLIVNVTFWLPHNQERVFGFLKNERNRSMWDMIARGHSVNETIHLDGDCSLDRSVSIIKMLDNDSNMVTTTLLQETCYDMSESYVVYAPIPAAQVLRVLDGQDNEDDVSIRASGFVMHQGGKDVGGCVVSALFQLLDRKSRVDLVPLESVLALYGFVRGTLDEIRKSLSQLSSTQNP